MVIVIGCDIIEIVRIKKAVERASFSERVFTPEEREYCSSRGLQAAASYAARFAAKEAVLKALGTGLRGGSLQEISITNDALGKPQVTLTGFYQELAKGKGVTKIHITMSHSRENAMATCVLED